MNASGDQVKSPLQAPASGDDEVIDLTEVMEEAEAAEVVEAEAEAVETEAEVVLDFRPERDDLDFLKSPAAAPPETPEPPAPPAEDSLDDFLASLPDIPEDLDIVPAPRPAAAGPSPELPRELAQRLSDEELKELVRQVIQETVERLARELFPAIASQAVNRELDLWKKRLSESDC